MQAIADSLKRGLACAAILACLCYVGPGAVVAAAAAATTATTDLLPTHTVLIGVSAALTGMSAPISENVVNAARLAVQAANRQRIVIGRQPVQFDLLIQDDRGDNNRALIAARYLNLAGVVGVIGNISTDASLATARAYNDAGIPHISATASGRAFTQQGFHTAFRVLGHDAAACALLGEFTVHTLHLSKIAIISNGTNFGDSLAQHCGLSFKDSGGTVILNETVKTKTSDFNGPLSRAGEADAIFLAGFSEQAPAIANAIKRLGLKARLITALNGAASDSTLLNSAAKNAEGAIAMENGVPMAQLPGVKALQAAYARKFEGTLSNYGLFAYDATTALIMAIQQANSLDQAQLVDSLHRLHFKGLSGTIAFTAEGDVISPTFTLFEVRKGKWVPLKIYSGK